MGRKCIVPGCGSTDRGKEIMHSLPVEPEQYHEWLRIIQREELKHEDRKKYRICDVHFSNEMKVPVYHSKTNLKRLAVPNIHIPISSMSKQEVKRPRMNSSSDPTDRDDGKHDEPASGDTESQHNPGIGQTQENPDCSTVASDKRPDVHKIDGNRICQIASQEFMEVQKTILFADKTEFIYDVFHAGAHVLHLFAPKRFGKSTFLDTIETCVSIKMNEHNEAIPNREDSEIYKLFMSLELGKRHPEFVKENCGLYPVIHMSFEDVRGHDMRSIEQELKSAVCNIFEHHKYLVKLVNGKKWVWRNPKLLEEGVEVETFLKYFLDSKRNDLTITDIKCGLLTLAKLLHIHFQQKVVILIDECDAPIMKGVQRGQSDEIVKGAIGLVGDVLKGALKGKVQQQHIRLGMLTSCTRLPGIFTRELNNPVDVYFLSGNRFSKLFGFTKEEILKMVSDPELKSICDESHIDKFDTIGGMDGIDEWYDGYEVLHDKETSIYCSYSLLKYMNNSIENNVPLLEVYWAGGGYLSTLGELFGKKEIREPIQQLLDGEPYKVTVSKVTIKNILGLRDTMLVKDKLTLEQVHFFLQLLSDDGVLNIIYKDSVSVILMIPNYENKIMIEHHCYTENLFKDVYRIKPENIATYISTLKSLLTQPGEEACRQFVNAVSNLYSGDAQLPANESEFNAHLYNLARLHLHLETQCNRSAEVMGQEKEPEAGPEFKPSARCNPDHKCKSNPKPYEQFKSKRGRKKEFDILVTFGTVGVIFELKYDDQSAQEALEQIYKKRYCRVFEKKEHVGVEKKIYVGLHMDNKRKVTMSAWLNGLRGKTVQVASDETHET